MGVRLGVAVGGGGREPMEEGHKLQVQYDGGGRSRSMGVGLGVAVEEGEGNRGPSEEEGH